MNMLHNDGKASMFEFQALCFLFRHLRLLGPFLYLGGLFFIFYVCIVCALDLERRFGEGGGGKES